MLHIALLVMNRLSLSASAIVFSLAYSLFPNEINFTQINMIHDMHIEDLTGVVTSYEICVTSFWRAS